MKRVVCAPEQRGPVDGVEGEEDDGEGHPRQPLYVAVPHPAQGRGGAGLHLPGRAGGGQEVAPPPHLPARASNEGSRRNHNLLIESAYQRFHI